MVILDKRGWKEKDFWERAYEEKERVSVYSKSRVRVGGMLVL